MRSVRLVTTGVLVLLLLGSAVAGAEPAPQITDMAGDANGLDAGEDTRPASYDPADLVAVTLQTEFVTAPDGSVEATALLIRFGTLAPPRSDASTMVFSLNASVDGCRSYFRAYVAGTLTHPADGRDGTVDWNWYENCPGTGPILDPFVSQGVAFENEAWTAEVDEESSELVVRIPFDSLDEQAAKVLKVGAVISEPRAMVRTSEGASVVGTFEAWVYDSPLDKTATGTSFTVGEDLPPDEG